MDLWGLIIVQCLYLYPGLVPLTNYLLNIYCMLGLFPSKGYNIINFLSSQGLCSFLGG